MLQLVGLISVVLEQSASLGVVGALLDGLPVDLELIGTNLSGELAALELGPLHQAVDVFQGQRFLGVVRLERVTFDVGQGAGMNLVAVALVRAMVTLEERFRTLGPVAGLAERNELQVDVSPELLHRWIELLVDELGTVRAERFVVHVDRYLLIMKDAIGLVSIIPFWCDIKHISQSATAIT